MALTTFNPSIAPSPGTKFKPMVNLHEAEFGDGYTQSAPRGLNHIREIIDLSWTGLTETQLIEIRTFFEDLGGYRPFYYQPRGRSATMKWTCKEWSGSDSSPWRFSAKFKQSFTTEV